MKLFTAEQVREWDQYTIQHEPVASIDLMERAAAACTEWIESNYPDAREVAVFCGKGNNGGDGLAIARMLYEKQYQVAVYILEFGHLGTPDFQINLARLHQLTGINIRFIQDAAHLPEATPGQLVIDALLGSGINRFLEGLTAAVAQHINQSPGPVISIDIPSGLFSDQSTKGQLTVRATHTLTFQCLKPAMAMAENAAAIGALHILDIGLHPAYEAETTSAFEMLDEAMAKAIYKPRPAYVHKGDCGKLLLVAGSYGKMGAAVLAAKAALRGGAGLVTCYIPRCGYLVLQTAVPEAMVITDEGDACCTGLNLPAGMLDKLDAVGAGPGLGTDERTIAVLEQLLRASNKPMVLDADALNTISLRKELLSLIPAGSVLTPHPVEFERLFGPASDDFARVELAREKAREHNCIILLKGHHSLVATPGGLACFNTTGNAGMATGGSGDVLTGLLTALLGAGYPPEQAALLGMFLHGRAGDLAAADLSQEAMMAGDITDYLGKAFLSLRS